MCTGEVPTQTIDVGVIIRNSDCERKAIHIEESQFWLNKVWVNEEDLCTFVNTVNTGKSTDYFIHKTADS